MRTNDRDQKEKTGRIGERRVRGVRAPKSQVHTLDVSSDPLPPTTALGKSAFKSDSVPAGRGFGCFHFTTTACHGSSEQKCFFQTTKALAFNLSKCILQRHASQGHFATLVCKAKHHHVHGTIGPKDFSSWGGQIHQGQLRLLGKKFLYRRDQLSPRSIRTIPSQSSAIDNGPSAI